MMALLSAGLNVFGQQKMVKQVNTVSDLVRQNPADVHQTVEVLGYYSPNDGGGGIFTVTNTASGVNDGTRFASTATGKSWERKRQDGYIYLKWFGAKCDGSTDDTAFATKALAACSDSHTFVLPENATSIWSGVVWNKNVKIKGQPGSILKRKAASTSYIVGASVDQSYGIEDVTFDGNKSEQTSSSYQADVVWRCAGGPIRNVRFQNYYFRGFYDQTGPGPTILEDIEIVDGQTWPSQGGSSDPESFGVAVSAVAQADGISPQMIVKNVKAWQTSYSTNRYPIAMIFAGNIDNPVLPSLSVENIEVDGLGGISVYRDMESVTMRKIRLKNMISIGLSVQDSTKVLLEDVIFTGWNNTNHLLSTTPSTAAAILVQPNLRNGGALYESVTLRDIMVKEAGIVDAIQVKGEASGQPLRYLNIENVHTTNSYRGVHVLNLHGEAIISGSFLMGNSFTNGASDGTLMIESSSGILTVVGCTINARKANGFYANSGVGSLSVVYDNNNTVSESGYTGAVFGTLASLGLGKNTWNAGGNAYVITGTNPKVSLNYHDQIFLSGSSAVSYTNLKVQGLLQGAGDPNGVVDGSPGTRWYDSSGNDLYIKNSASGTLTGWDMIPVASSVVSTVSGTANEVEVSGTTSVIVGLPNSPVITTSMGVGGTSPGVAQKLYVVSNDDAIRQVRFDMLSTGTAASGQFVLANSASSGLVLEVFGTGHATTPSQVWITGTGSLWYRVSGNHLFQVSGITEMSVASTGVTVTDTLRVGGNITNDVLTASRMVGTDANKALVSLSLSSTEVEAKDAISINGSALTDSLGVNLLNDTWDVELVHSTGPSPDEVDFRFMRVADPGTDPALLANQVTIGDIGIVYEGATANAFEGELVSADVTADRVWTLPNQTGTVALTSDIAAWILVDGLASSDGYNFSSTPFDITLSEDTGTTPDTVNVQFARAVAIGDDPTLLANYATFGTTGVIFEGATANGFEGLLAAADPTADRTWTLKDRTGTLAVEANSSTAMQVGTVASDPAALADGEIWYNSGDGLLKARVPGQNTTVGLLSSYTANISTRINENFRVSDALLAGGAALDATENNKRILLDAAATETATWQFVLPFTYNSGSSSIEIFIYYSMASATSGDVVWEAGITAVTPGDSEDINSATGSSSNQTSTVPGTAGYLGRVKITPTTDSAAAGDYMRIYIARNGGNGSDTATGDAEVVGVVAVFHQ